MLITPNYHFTGDCEDALKLYEKAFNGKLTTLMHYCDAHPSDISTEHMTDKEKNQVYHAEMIIGNQRFMFSDSRDKVLNLGYSACQWRHVAKYNCYGF